MAGNKRDEDRIDDNFDIVDVPNNTSFAANTEQGVCFVADPNIIHMSGLSSILFSNQQYITTCFATSAGTSLC